MGALTTLVKPWRLLLVAVVLFSVVQYALYAYIAQPADQTSPTLRKGRPISGVEEQSTDSTDHGLRKNALAYTKQHRVAVLLPYLGKSLPAWFDLFAFTAHTSSELVDWYIFITEAPVRVVPSNVHLIRLPRSSIFERLATLDERYDQGDEKKTQLQSYFEQLITVHPYILVEIKPALGYLFEDYTRGYSHWAYADLDLLMGRLQVQIRPDQLDRHDIITLSFGDNNRLYMRGQFTIHRNTANVTNLWRGCSYLTDIGSRMNEFFTQKKRWAFHSAEGCYSRVVADHPQLSVLYAPLQFSDAFAGSLDQKETMLLGGALTRCYGRSISASILKHKYDDTYISGQGPEGPQHPLNRITTQPLHCSYWVDPADQVCTEFVPANASIVLEQGRLTYTSESSLLDGHCREASIAHFQGWKRDYFAYTARVPPSDAHAMVISDAGVVPLVLRDPAARSYRHAVGGVVPDGRLHPSDLQAAAGSAVRTLRSVTHAMSVPRLLGTVPDRHRVGKEPTGAGVVEPLATVYCLRHSADLKRCEAHVLGDDITVIPALHQRGPGNDDAVTLIAVGWLPEYERQPYDQQFDGPQILVLAHVETFTDRLHQVRAHTKATTLILVNVTSAGLQEPAVPGAAQSWRLPDKALYNIGLDAAASDLVLLAPDRATLQTAGFAQQYALRSVRAADIQIMLRAAKDSNVFREAVDHAVLTPALVFPVLVPEKGGEFNISCGQDQPASLQFSLASVHSGQFVEVPFNSQELSRERTYLLPVAFNLSASPHGRGFFRLPEELNGAGCHDAFAMRALAGSGYKLMWAVADDGTALVARSAAGNSAALAASPVLVKHETAGDGTAHYRTHEGCGCNEATDEHKRLEMVARANRYFQKAVELRRAGLSNTYSREAFGTSMEQDQRKQP